MLRKLVPGAALLIVTACSAAPEPPPPPPTIDFEVAGKSVAADPFLYCTVNIEDCRRDNGAMVKLTVPPGGSVKITVPREVADTPWSVVIQYANAAGELLPPETVETFAPGENTTFEAKPPNPTDQLQTVEVKQAGAKMVQSETGPEAVTRAVWSAQIAP